MLAALAEMIAAQGGNIEGAVMSIVAWNIRSHVFFVAAADRKILEPAVKKLPALIVNSTEMEPADADWPRPGSTWWHA